MNPILFSTAYFPPVSWMAVAILSENFAIEIHETYPKQTFRNRCSIATSTGILNLTVPVHRTHGNHTKTCDIVIDNSINWQQHHWRTIVTSYSKSPYFLYYRDAIEPIFTKKHTFLIELNHEVLNLLFRLFSGTARFFYTEQYHTNGDFSDLRNYFSPKSSHPLAIELPRYIQTFEEKNGFIADLSIIDLLFNLGPDALPYMAKVKPAFQV